MSKLKDINGKESSKRKQGIILITVALIMAAIQFSAGLIMTYKGLKYEDNFPIEIWYTIIGTGTTLLGVTLFERPLK